MKEINQKADIILDSIMRLPEDIKNYSSDGDPMGKIEIIIKYDGDIEKIAKEMGIEFEKLSEKYAILTLEQDKIQLLSKYKEIEYLERPKRLINSTIIFENEDYDGNILDRNYLNNLTGKGVIIGLIDSGIDYTKSEFINKDGTTKIISIWDQTISIGNSPNGFKDGTEWIKDDVNKALSNLKSNKGSKIISHIDAIGHGTNVAGIMAGNDNTSNSKHIGVAPEAELMVVKLDTKGEEDFSSTSKFMKAIKYLISKSKELKKPLVINTSFDINEEINGNSIFKDFIDEAMEEWPVTMVIGSDIREETNHHIRGKIKKKEETNIEFKVGEEERVITLDMWKNLYDEYELELISPSGKTTSLIKENRNTNLIKLDNTECYIIFKEPDYKIKDQQILILLIPEGDYIEEGIWRIKIHGKDIIDGSYDIWLPKRDLYNEETKFIQSKSFQAIKAYKPLDKIINVDDYKYIKNSINTLSHKVKIFKEKIKNNYSPNSKSDKIFNILHSKNNRNISFNLGTSIVAGVSALLMEWGIVKGNDPLMYGEKIKGYILTEEYKYENNKADFTNKQIEYGSLALNGLQRNRVENRSLLSNKLIDTNNQRVNRSIYVLDMHPRKVNPVFLSYMPIIFDKYR